LSLAYWIRETSQTFSNLAYEAPKPGSLDGIIAMSSQVILDNVARVFSLVRALSGVRFRMVVNDIQGRALVTFGVVVGMNAGATHTLVPVISLALVELISLLLWPRCLAGPGMSL
jgi:hypothetical protein